MQTKKIITAEFIYYGQEPNLAQIEMWAQELSNFSSDDIFKTYRSLRNAHTKVPQPQFIKRALLGYVDSDEAWSLLPQNEDDCVIWNQAMRPAWGGIKDLMAVDQIAARMAFKKSYDFEVLDRLSKNEKAVWDLSEGRNKEMRDQKLKQAIDRGWIKPKHAVEWSPDLALPPAQMLQLPEPVYFDPEKREDNLIKIKEFLSNLSKKTKKFPTDNSEE